jgi:hypothetical protein
MQTNITGNLVAEITELIAKSKEEHLLQVGDYVMVMYDRDVRFWKVKGQIVGIQHDLEGIPVYMVKTVDSHSYILIHYNQLIPITD